MHGTSDAAQNGRDEEGLNENETAGVAASREREAGDHAAPENTSHPPVLESPPTSPQDPQQASPWWTAPGGKPVDIPDFGHVLFAALRALLAPAPQPIPVRIRTRR